MASCSSPEPRGICRPIHHEGKERSSQHTKYLEMCLQLFFFGANLCANEHIFIKHTKQINFLFR